MNDFFHFDLGNAVTWGLVVIGFVYNHGKSAQRFANNAERIKAIEALLDKGTPLTQAVVQRLNVHDIQIAALQVETSKIATLHNDMSWIKGTVLAIANKLSVTTIPYTAGS